MLTLNVFCVDLQDLVMSFAYGTGAGGAKFVKKNVNTLCYIKSLALPRFFFQYYIPSWKKWGYVVNPMFEYSPCPLISDIFNMYHIKEVMYALDFRKRSVKALGSRFTWFEMMETHYDQVLNFGIFYKVLMASGGEIWTPTYSRQLKNGGHTYWH